MKREKSNYQKQLINMVVAAMFAAIITVVTAYILHIPTGINSGYIHLGDCFIYLAASFLPTPYAMVASAVGAGLADQLTAPVWVIPTVIIKSILVLPFTSKSKKIINKRNIIAIFLGIIITSLGYYIAEYIMFKNTIAVLVSIVPSIIQSSASGLLFVLIGLALDKINFKDKIKNYR